MSRGQVGLWWENLKFLFRFGEDVAVRNPNSLDTFLHVIISLEAYTS